MMDHHPVRQVVFAVLLRCLPYGGLEVLRSRYSTDLLTTGHPFIKKYASPVRESED
jgi:hypothetical protein